MAISIEQYGWEKKKNGHFPSEIEENLLRVSEITEFTCIKAHTIKDTLKFNNLSGNNINISKPNMVLLQNIRIDIDEKNENVKITPSENKILCLFRHLRNALAHGNTYFFDNGNMLLEDKENRKITARILIHQNTLLEWIRVIDKNNKRYTITEVKNRKEE